MTLLFLHARSIFRNITHLIFPSRCVICDAPAGGNDGTLCPVCWNQLDYLISPLCSKCGVPMETAVPGESSHICAGCQANPPLFDKARAAFVYNDMSAALISRLKFYDGLHLLPFLAAQTARIGHALLSDCDYMVPVPMHRARLRRRMYNQSALLAKHISGCSGTPVRYDILHRTRNTAPQTGTSRKARLRNLNAAFDVPDNKRDAVYGKHLLLIDDVLTTGATVSRCTSALKKAGASSVSVLTVCRTPLR